VILAGRCDIFSLSKRGKQYYARFWSESEQRYTVARATGATNKAQAGRIAQQMLQRGNVVPRTTDPLLVDYIADYWTEPQYAPRTVNRIMQAVVVPIGHAFERDRILSDPTAGLRRGEIRALWCMRLLAKLWRLCAKIPYAFPEDFVRPQAKRGQPVAADRQKAVDAGEEMRRNYDNAPEGNVMRDVKISSVTSASSSTVAAPWCDRITHRLAWFTVYVLSVIYVSHVCIDRTYIQYDILIWFGLNGMTVRTPKTGASTV
jgi:hypothetical protein